MSLDGEHRLGNDNTICRLSTVFKTSRLYTSRTVWTLAFS